MYIYNYLRIVEISYYSEDYTNTIAFCGPTGVGKSFSFYTDAFLTAYSEVGIKEFRSLKLLDPFIPLVQHLKKF